MIYTIQVFKPNKGSDAKHRIVIPYHCEAANVGEAYEKAKKDLKDMDVGFGFIIPAKLNVLT